MSTIEKITDFLKAETSPYPVDCFAVPGSDSIIDTIHPVTGKGVYGGQTLEEVQQEEPLAVVMSVELFCEQKAARQDTPIEWHEITEEQYENWFECLPPAAYAENGFLVGEPFDHHAGSGKPRYQACRRVGGKYLASNRPLTKREFKELTDVS